MSEYEVQPILFTGFLIFSDILLDVAINFSISETDPQKASLVNDGPVEYSPRQARVTACEVYLYEYASDHTRQYST